MHFLHYNIYKHNITTGIGDFNFHINLHAHTRTQNYSTTLHIN